MNWRGTKRNARIKWSGLDELSCFLMEKLYDYEKDNKQLKKELRKLKNKS